MNGEDPSAAGCVAEPGQRRSWPVFSLSRPCCGVTGVSVLFAPSAKSSNTGVATRVVAVGVVVAGGRTEVADEALRGRGFRYPEGGGYRDRFLLRGDANRRGGRPVPRVSAGRARIASVRSLFGPGLLNA